MSRVAWRGGPAQACHSSEWGGSPLGHLIERVAGGVQLPYLTRTWPPWEQEVGEGEDGRGTMGGGAGGAPMASAAGGDVGGEAGRYGCSLIASAREKKSRGVAPRRKESAARVGAAAASALVCFGRSQRREQDRGKG
jgi:hypothetical protein